MNDLQDTNASEEQKLESHNLISRQELDLAQASLAREKGNATIQLLADRIKNLAAAGGGTIDIFGFGYDDHDSDYCNTAVLEWATKTWIRETTWLYRRRHSSSQTDYGCFPLDALPLWQRHVLSELKRLGYEMTCSVGNYQVSIALIV